MQILETREYAMTDAAPSLPFVDGATHELDETQMRALLDDPRYRKRFRLKVESPTRTLSEHDRRRVTDSVVVALRQGRIGGHEAASFASLAEHEGYEPMMSALLARRPKVDADALYRSYADATGVRRPERREVIAADRVYAEFAAACGIRDAPSLRYAS